jgi:hypothetical protein
MTCLACRGTVPGLQKQDADLSSQPDEPPVTALAEQQAECRAEHIGNNLML